MKAEYSEHKPKLESIISALFLVAGTCIGGGMLALPVATGISGFLPSVAAMFLCWMMMTGSALLLLEASLWMKEGEHMISIASRLLGAPGRIICWILYLFISYCSIVAYTAGGGGQVVHALNAFAGWELSKSTGCLLFVVVLGVVVDLGTRIVGRVNAILFIAMMLAYVFLIIMGVSEVKSSLLLENQNWSYSLMAIPLLLTSFSFQTMVPSLTPYLNRHVNALRGAIIGGTSLTFIVYLVWEWLVLGIIPIEGPSGLASALAKGNPATQFLRQVASSPYLWIVAEYFAFFALVTSFLGITLGLFDFLSDGLKLKKEGTHKIVLAVLIIVPTLFFATNYERAFIVALESSGGFGDSLLNGIIPILMVWVGRYSKKLPSNPLVPGGKFVLGMMFLFFVFTLFLEVLLSSGVIFSIRDVQTIFELYQGN